MTAAGGAPTAIFWLRRDLRLHDNAGLWHALNEHARVQPVFIFDTDILGALRSRADRRVDFIHQALRQLDAALRRHGSALRVYVGTAEEAFGRILQDFAVSAVYANEDYEPVAVARDARVQRLLAARGVAWHGSKDQVVFAQREVVKDDGQPYTVFTPYSRKWKSRLDASHLQPWPSEQHLANLAPADPADFAAPAGGGLPELAALGFEPTGLVYAPPSVPAKLLRAYQAERDFPAAAGTSQLGVHLRFGTGSIRALVQTARGLSETFLNELIWREFFQMLLWHYPQTVDKAFKPAYDAIAWRNDVSEFERWKVGTTGYPLVDAGMRELNATGFMHNRVRMVVASFLCKHLLIDWRWGEAYFAAQLLDYDQSANVGNWQWAAGCGADAAPYFRVFNPELQAGKFDRDGRYIRHWVPEWGSSAYPSPMVEHAAARQRCLDAYRKALESAD
ncbi:deoxyribodipyrimidine photo-lyase [Corticibacter populi]|uniref:Deoxyribodipyrimidine photo-lyase n=1 Tax=Corticibacter populi TaxID=1550736 RepID=A0A3M6QXZ8_9BURK|nr:deoxyribodipyrimidine photo-lyase [Corticibacter populi]RMX07887.1 deoxyribodipyrimidine photo-lyase [Corticibacter populi]RZS35127.1 deoxyribodipyrimidine photo-lyase [Corticibacter populi]